jgi:hypothetical protein
MSGCSVEITFARERLCCVVPRNIVCCAGLTSVERKGRKNRRRQGLQVLVRSGAIGLEGSTSLGQGLEDTQASGSGTRIVLCSNHATSWRQ